MSLDSSLKTKGKLTQKRSVLSRPERLAQLKEEGKMNAKNERALGLPKTRVRE